MKRNIPNEGQYRGSNASVAYLDNGIVRFTSYASVVADYDSANDKVTLYPLWDYSQSTTRQVGKFLHDVLGEWVSTTDIRANKHPKVFLSAEAIISYVVPRGSGFNSDWDVARKNKNTVATTYFHVLDENGYWDGFIGVKVTLPYKDAEQFDIANLRVVATDWRGNPTVRKYWTNRGYGEMIYDTVYHSFVKAFDKMKGV